MRPTGLGRALAVELARAGATVLAHGRDDRRGREAVDAIRAETGSDRVEWLRAHLASLAEVRELGAHVEARHERLDVLVNNAGVGSTPPGDGARMTSADGHELRFAVNHLAPFLLAKLLARSAPSRVVNVASAGQAPIDFEDVMLERRYSGVQAYCQSKLAPIMATFDLAADLRDRGVTANALHPGTYMPTTMVEHAGISPVDSLESGVRATARLAIADDVVASRGGTSSGRATPAPTPRPTTRRPGGGCGTRASP